MTGLRFALKLKGGFDMATGLYILLALSTALVAALIYLDEKDN